MLKLEFTGQFKKDYKLAVKRGFDIQELEKVIKLLREEIPLPPKYTDHKLSDSRKYKNMRECHIEPDWLLVYQKDKGNLILKMIRTGTHSDLFR